MTPEMILYIVAGGAVGLVILIAVGKKLRGPAQEQPPVGSTYFAKVSEKCSSVSCCSEATSSAEATSCSVSEPKED